MRVDFRIGDAQALPFGDASFDIVLSVFGVMFAPDQEKAASELLRVCRPGGRVGLCSWMPTDFGGEFFAIHARHAPPPPGVKPPVRWGTDAGLVELFAGGTHAIKSERRTVFQYYRSVDHAIDVFRTYFGPTNRAFQIVDATGQASLQKDLETLFSRYNRATDGTLVLEAVYLQTIATRR
jgi:ubiquinone/menaquinone biosynthesis C-methylase UbiE